MTAAVVQPDGGRGGARYLPVGAFFLRESLGLGRAARLLWQQQTDFLGSEGKKVGNDAYPSGVFRLVATAKQLLRFLYARYVNDSGALELPLQGDLAIVRLSGAIKLLDLERSVVYTIMAEGAMRSKLAERVKAAQKVGRWSFAPRFVAADLGQGWLAEEHVAGEHPTGFRGCTERFEEYYRPLLVDFLRAEKPVSTSLNGYVTGLVDDIFAPDGLLPRVEPELRREITTFVEECRDRIREALADGDREVVLVLSHGDFFSGNVIITPSGVTRAIDWATTGTRSALHDLYYLLMNHCVRVMSPAQRARRLGEMLTSLRSQLGATAPETLAQLEPELSTAPELRWLFYLQCVHVPLMHCVDADDRYIRSLATRLGWFKEYELATKDLNMQMHPTAAANSGRATAEGFGHA